MEQMNDKPASSQIMFLLRLENWKHDVPWSVAKPLWFIFRYGVRTQVFVTALGIDACEEMAEIWLFSLTIYELLISVRPVTPD